MLSGLQGEANEQISSWTINHKVVYTSRTHSQLAQVMRELKFTEYNHLKAVALGSRDQLCINEDVLKDAATSSEKIHMCRAKVKAKQCNYYKNVERTLENSEVMKQPVTDIEDLVKLGKSCNACPYYMARGISGSADIVFLPYNYVLDPKLLKSASLKLEKSVVILDEAHNVEKVCQDAASAQIASSDIATCIEDIQYIMKQLSADEQITAAQGDSDVDFTIEDCAKLIEMMLAFEKEVDAIDQVDSKKGRTFPGGKIFEILSAADITPSTFPIIIKSFGCMLDFHTNSTAGKIFARKGFGLQKVEELLETVFGSMTQESDNWKKAMAVGYRLHVELEEPKKKWSSKTSDNDGWTAPAVQQKINKSAKVLNYWCFNPGFGMANLTNRKVHSIILTSGTLAPIKPLIDELALNVNFQLENPHVIKPSQVLAKIIPCGPNNVPFNSSYNSRDDPKYINSLAMMISNFARYTPNGFLVFFTSYPQMTKMQDVWKSSRMWDTINDVKPIFTEPKGKNEFDECIQDYYTAAKTSRGAIFMAVLRGKVSEGLDFKDHNGRCVVIIGLPFPPFFDPRVTLKKEYLQAQRQSGQDWYNMEATRAVNQAIGRVIRHKDDYGAILLCDQRFSNYKAGLSKWVQSHMAQNISGFNFGRTIKELRLFFENASQALPKPVEIKQEPQDDEKKYQIQDIRSAKERTEVIKKQHLKIENSNEIYGSGSSQRSLDAKSIQPFIKQESKPKTFMSGLSKDITSIDFNVTVETDQSSSSSFLSQSSSKQSASLSLREHENASKKPRLTLKPNATSNKVSFVMIQEPVKVTKIHFDQVVPDNRSEFKELVRKA